jgi:hypothetical protein
MCWDIVVVSCRVWGKSAGKGVLGYVGGVSSRQPDSGSGARDRLLGRCPIWCLWWVHYFRSIGVGVFVMTWRIGARPGLKPSGPLCYTGLSYTPPRREWG